MFVRLFVFVVCLLVCLFVALCLLAFAVRLRLIVCVCSWHLFGSVCGLPRVVCGSGLTLNTVKHGWSAGVFCFVFVAVLFYFRR